MRLRGRIFLELLQRDADGALQLRIVAGGDGFRIELDFHVGRDAGVFRDPFAGGAVKMRRLGKTRQPADPFFPFSRPLFPLVGAGRNSFVAVRSVAVATAGKDAG